jgi:hypothetical protein
MGPLWDFDKTMGGDPGTLNPIGWLGQRFGIHYAGLFEDPAFERAYAQRWQQLQCEGLSLDKVLAKVDSMVEELDEAQARNFSRWSVNFGAGGWRGELDRLKQWLTDRFLWINRQLAETPSFSLLPGRINPPAELEILNPNACGDIVYTLNGPDPVSPDGSLAPEALVYEGPLTITDNVRVRTRVQFNPLVSSNMEEVFFLVSGATIAITELMYRPGGGFTSEFVELHNFGSEPVKLRQLRFTRGVQFDMSESAAELLEPGGYALLVGDPETFRQEYDTTEMSIIGQYTRALNNRILRIAMEGSEGEPLFELTYSNLWYPETSGQGHSLVLRDLRSSPGEWGEPKAWRPSTVVGGSPGGEDKGGSSSGGQLIGDVNQDSRRNLPDAIVLLRRLFRGADSDSMPCEGETIHSGGNRVLFDLDGDGEVARADAVFLLSYLFLTGSPPARGTHCVAIEGCPEACTPQ